MNRSEIKTWFKRNRFKCGRQSIIFGAVPIIKIWNDPFRKHWQYCDKGGRHYRIRKIETGWVVDTSDLDFDRWANSTEIHAQPIAEFITSFCKMREEIKEILSGEPHH